MIECIDKFFPEGTKRTFPDGGLLPGRAAGDTTELWPAVSSPDVKVACVTGEGSLPRAVGRAKTA